MTSTSVCLGAVAFMLMTVSPACAQDRILPEGSLICVTLGGFDRLPAQYNKAQLESIGCMLTPRPSPVKVIQVRGPMVQVAIYFSDTVFDAWVNVRYLMSK